VPRILILIYGNLASADHNIHRFVIISPFQKIDTFCSFPFILLKFLFFSYYQI